MLERLKLLFVLCFAVALSACQPDIGDACRLPSDCSVNGDRICDPTFQNGYCTEFNCEPGGCPEEAICVGYRRSSSSHPECETTQGGSRFSRTFCMKSCTSDDDCRVSEGYACIDVRDIPEWGAEVIESGSRNGRVCAWPYSGAPLEGPRPPICLPSDFDAGLPPLWTSESDAGGGVDGAGPPSADAASPVDGNLEARVPEASVDAAVDVVRLDAADAQPAVSTDAAVDVSNDAVGDATSDAVAD